MELAIPKILETNNLGSFIYHWNHTFYPYQSYKIKNLWRVVSAKRIETEKSTYFYHKDFAVIADSPEDAVREAIKSYFRNKCEDDEPIQETQKE